MSYFFLQPNHFLGSFYSSKTNFKTTYKRTFTSTRDCYHWICITNKHLINAQKTSTVSHEEFILFSFKRVILVNEIENISPHVPIIYRNTRRSLGELEIVWKHSPLIQTLYFYVTIRLTVIFFNLTTGKTNFRSQLKMLSTVLYHYLKSPLYHSSNTRRKSQSAFLTHVVNFENPNKVNVGYLKETMIKQ